MIADYPPVASASPLLQGAAATRLVARQTSELILLRGLRWQAAFDIDRFDSLVLQIVLSANLAHLPYHNDADPAHGIAAPDALRRPVSVMAIARSMSLPYETVRRRSRALAAAGLIVQDGAGCTMPAAHFAAPAASRLAGEDKALLRATLEALAQSGHGPSATAAALTDAVADGPVARLVLDFTMRVFENFVKFYGDFASGTIAAAITAANVRHLVADPVLSRRYAEHDRIAPDDMREPIGPRALARELDLPFETVRRRIAALTESGIVEQKGDGVIVPVRVLIGEDYRQNNAFITAQFERMAATVARLADGSAEA